MKLSLVVAVNLTMKFDTNNNNSSANKGAVREQTCILSLPSNILIRIIKDRNSHPKNDQKYMTF